MAPQVDPGPFLAAVEAAKVVPLAARPLSLKLLAATYRKAGNLPKRASELYELGLLTLCEEMNPERRDAASDAAVGAKTRLDTASRIAAFSILGGRPTVWTGPVVEADPADLTIDDCTRTPAPGTFQPAITNATVAATLRTGLFTGASSQRLGWSHATFADFLAARWILEQNLARTQVRSLLVSPDGKVHPRVRQVAAWVVAIQPEQFGWLIPADPEAFLLNVDIPDDALRAEVVAEILTNAKAGRLYHDYNRSFSGVTHPLLADQLRAVLADANLEVRSVAVDIARQCNVIALVPDITAIALDSEADERLRVSAALTVHDLSQDSPSHDLATLLKSPAGIEEDATHGQELEAAALIASWPHAISTAEVFDLLDPQHPRNYFGLYSTFVSTFAKSLKDNDLEAAIAWLMNHSDRLDDSRLMPLVNAVVSLGIKHMDRSDARDAVKMVAFKRADNYEPLFTDEVLEGEHELTVDDRRSLALALLEDASEGQVFSVVDPTGMHGLSLLGPNDFAWLIDQYATVDNELKSNLAKAISYVFAPDDPSHIEVVLGLPEDHLAADLFSYWRDTVDLDSAEAKAARESWHKQAERINEQVNRRKNAKRPDLWVDPRIAELAAKAKAGDTDAFWRAADIVTVRPGTLRYMDEYQPDLAAHPRWKTLKKKTRKDMLAAAAVYVRHGKCRPEEWLAQDLRWRPAEAGYRALILLLRKRPEELESFEPAVWREWAPIMVSWSATINGAQADDKRVLFGLALPHAREELTAALLQLVDKAIADSKHTFLREELDLLHSDHLAAALIDRLEATDVPVEARSDILETLTTHHIELIRPLLLTWLQREQRTADRERARDAAARLMWSDAHIAWPTLSELMQSDPEFMKEVFLSANHPYDRRAPDLTEAQLADLYTWLHEQFPASDDPQFEDAHFVGPRESLARWRESILENLKQRGTKAAVAAVARIADTHPDQPWLQYAVIDAQRAYRDESWEPLTGQQLDQLTANRESRLVRTEADLFAVTLAALEGSPTGPGRPAPRRRRDQGRPARVRPDPWVGPGPGGQDHPSQDHHTRRDRSGR